MSDCQKDGARASITGRAYLMIKPIFDDLPNRFEIKDVMKAGKIPAFLGGSVKNVLRRTFKCIEVGERGDTWKKP